MIAGSFRHLRWSRVGIAVSAGLIVFGIVEAALPHHPPTRMSGPATSAGAAVTTSVANSVATADVRTQDMSAQRVAEEFVAATDTTDPAHVQGIIATEVALAPHLVIPHSVTWPAAWTAEQRRTVVVLDLPGPPLSVAGGQVAVIVTGTMTVTMNFSRPLAVPVAERVTLRHLSGPPGPASRVSGGRTAGRWVVTAVEAGP